MYFDFSILFLTPFGIFRGYPFKPFVKLEEQFVKALCFFFDLSVGFNNNVQSAGVNDNAINADIITDIAMVMANCWYKRPTIPGIKPTGTNTAASINAMAITGADISFMAW